MRQRIAAAATLVVVVVAACSAAGPIGAPSQVTWSKPMTETTCEEWQLQMTDGDRGAAAAAYVGVAESERLHLAINGACNTLADLADDPSDPALISDVIELVARTEDFELIQ
jgi:hypothetical protein